MRRGVRTKHTDAAGFAALAHYSVPHIVGLGSTLSQAAVAGFVAMLPDVLLTANLQTHNDTLQLDWLGGCR